MVLAFKVDLDKEKLTVKMEFLFTLMDHFIEVISKAIKSKEKEDLNMLTTVLFMKVIGKQIDQVDMENKLLKTETLMWEIS